MMDSVLENKIALDIIDTVRDPALLLNSNLRIIFANEAFYEMFGVTAVQTEGRLIYELGNQQWNIPRLRKLLEEILPKKNAFRNYEISHSFPNIGHKVMRLNGRQVYGPRGNAPEILLLLEDITQRKEAEHDLAVYISGLKEQAIKSNATLSLGKAREAAILESIGEGIIVMTDVQKGGRIIYTNRTCERMTGWSKDEMVNKLLVNVIPRVDKNGKEASLRERGTYQILNGQPATASLKDEYFYVRKDKTMFPMAGVMTPIIVRKKIVGAVELFRDTTSESAADKAKTEFASMVSHQLRTPFSTINWYVELLLDGDFGKLNTKQTAYLQEVYRASQRMVKLINVLLSISRIEMGITADERTYVNVVELAEGMIRERQHEITVKQLELTKVFSKKTTKLYVDSKQIEMIFQNLLSNAIKYTPVGGSITFKIKSNKANLLISVADTGIGIPQQSEPEVFNRFFRAANAVETEQEGTGLGLYIIKSIVEKMSGVIWFTANKPQGTVFHVSLPRNKPKKEV